MVREFVRHGSNALLLAGAAALAAAAAAGRLPVNPAWVAGGAALFFANEYGTHRFLLHAKPSPLAFVRRLQHRLHYDHHSEPGRLELLFLPPWFLLPALAAFAALYARVAPRRAPSLVLGNLLGLVYYEWVHYVAHVPFRPRTRFGRFIKKYHLRHHFLNETLWFGVTNPSFDVLAGTYRRVADAERSDRVRSLDP